MTIEERANSYSFTIPTNSQGYVTPKRLKEAYAQGATDQQAIDIEKACEWLKRELADPMPEDLYQQWCEEKLADFRKAMTEQ